MNRCYFACFQAAVAALLRADVRPTGRVFPHDFAQKRFEGILIERRKAYPSRLVGVLQRLRDLRTEADYRYLGVSQRDASRALRAAIDFVHEVARS